MKHIWIALISGLILTACGGSAETQSTQEKAGHSDVSAMKDLEKQVRDKARADKAARKKAAQTGDARAAFLKAWLSGKKSGEALQKLAQAGNPHAQVYLAHIKSAEGRASEADKAIYRGWLENAAQNAIGEQHQTLSGLTYPLSGEAAFLIAEDYLGADKLYGTDQSAALKWLKTAADQGQPAAMYKLAIRYQYGLDVDEDLTAAKSWMQKSADAGWRDAVQGLKGLE
jgi:TPR repeat protein